MRKILTVLLLAILAILSVTAAVFLRIDGSLARLTGWYHFRPGMKLFPEENIKLLKQVCWMRIQDLHDTIECRRESDGSWWIVSPFRDRLSTTALQHILAFTAQAELVDTLPLNHTTSASLREYGVEASPHTITLKYPTSAAEGDLSTLARYTLGSASPWVVNTKASDQVMPTTYLRTDFYGRDKRIHVVSGDILFIFRNGLEGLRDPHITNIEPDSLLSFVIHKEGEPDVCITRQSAESPWIITSPTICEASQDNVESMVSLLSRLKAVRIDDASSVQLPPAPACTITLTAQGREPLSIHFYEPFVSPTDGQLLCYATVDDRPVVFTLPVEPRLRRKGSYSDIVSNVLSMPVLPADVLMRLQSANDTVYFSDLALELKDLRSTRLSNIDSRDVDKVYIRSRFARYPVTLRRIPGDSEGQVNDVWMYSAAGQRFQEADPTVVAEFLNSLSKVPVSGFERDFTPGEDILPTLKKYGLITPDYLLMLQPRECVARAMLFGIDMPLVKDRSPRTFYLKRYRDAEKGSYWVAMEQNMFSIYRLSTRMTRLFAFTPEAWKKRNMVQFPISSLRTLTFHYQQAALKLHYDYIGGVWTGTLNDEDITPRINPHRSDYFVRHLQNIRVEQWLPSDNEDALAALQSPAFSLSLELEETDYSDIEHITVDQQDDMEETLMSANNAQALLDADDATNEKFLQIASGDHKKVKRNITLEIAPAPVRMSKPYFYGRIRETGELFILSYENAQGLDGQLLD